MERTYDFAGWATRNDIKCTDGRTIRKDAFKDDDRKKVPIVWMHSHNDPTNVLGHAILENRPEGVYTYGYFNDTKKGKHAKSMVQHGDITGLSIWANGLKQTSAKDVLHGSIKEVSLVLAGANPQAYIDEVLMHSDDGNEFDGIIFTGMQELELCHDDMNEDDDSKDEPKEEENKKELEPEKSEDDSKEESEETKESEESEESEETKEDKPKEDTLEHSETTEKQENKSVSDILNTMTEEQKNAVYSVIGSIIGTDDSEDEEDTLEHSETSETNDKTLQEIFDSMSEEQQDVAFYMIGKAIEENKNIKHNDGGNEEMKHNVFDQTEDNTNENVLSHDQMTTIINDAKRHGSMKDSFLAHAEKYGIDNIEYLFPEARSVTNQPTFIQRDMGWVQKVMSGIHKVPFSRIKSVFADITEDEARAKGYIKGNLKKEEVFSLLKRTTTPTTIYKKQKMDRDDMVDITDFDVIAWLKSEMRMMLDEEIARSILIGDGRLASSDDKINEQNIRPIARDEDLFTVKVKVSVKNKATDDEKAKAFIRSVIKSRKQYKGSGNPTLYTTEDMVTDCLLLTDEMGRDLYDSVEKLRIKLRVKEIVTVEPMESAVGKDGKPLMGILVNLNDYNCGADKGGAINMFDDFDIDYNQQKYLIETRCSGALVKPFSAIAYTLDEAAM